MFTLYVYKCNIMKILLLNAKHCIFLEPNITTHKSSHTTTAPVIQFRAGIVSLRIYYLHGGPDKDRHPPMTWASPAQGHFPTLLEKSTHQARRNKKPPEPGRDDGPRLPSERRRACNSRAPKGHWAALTFKFPVVKCSVPNASIIPIEPSANPLQGLSVSSNLPTSS